VVNPAKSQPAAISEAFQTIYTFPSGGSKKDTLSWLLLDRQDTILSSEIPNVVPVRRPFFLFSDEIVVHHGEKERTS